MTLKYTEDHEWLKIEGDIVTVGITHHAQDALGDVVFVDLPSVGTALAQKETAGVVESVKAAADVYTESVHSKTAGSKTRWQCAADWI